MSFDMLKNYQPKVCDHQECREFAVLIPIVECNGQPCIVFQIRSGRLLKQPNEICFPGGRLEEDESPLQAVIRETCEEMLITEDNIEIIGEIDTLVTPFNTVIYPFAAYLKDYRNSFSPDEVQEVFAVPIDWLKKHPPQSSSIDVIMQPPEDFPFEKIQLGRNYPWARGKYPVYLYEYEDKVIWGITARILRSFLEIISKNKA